LSVGTEGPYDPHAIVLTAVYVSQGANVNVNINKVIQLQITHKLSKCRHSFVAPRCPSSLSVSQYMVDNTVNEEYQLNSGSKPYCCHEDPKHTLSKNRTTAFAHSRLQSALTGATFLV
jgi:hypothetical protein